jgi:hypothetical protein
VITELEGQLQARTVVNYTSALQWHLIYLRYLLHADASVSEREEPIRTAVKSSSKKEDEEHLKEMKAAMKKIKGMIQQAAPLAERQTIQRNGKEQLVACNWWVEVDFMRGLHVAIDDEGWAWLNSLKRRITLLGDNSFAKVNLLFAFYLFNLSFLFRLQQM